jgi:hypothetical protein
MEKNLAVAVAVQMIAVGRLIALVRNLNKACDQSRSQKKEIKLFYRVYWERIMYFEMER